MPKRSTVPLIGNSWLSIKHFCSAIDGRSFYVLTDHKAFIAAITHPPADPSPCRFHYFDYISQFTTDIRYIKGADNCVGDLISCIDSISSLLDLSHVATLQAVDEATMQLIHDTSSSL